MMTKDDEYNRRLADLKAQVSIHCRGLIEELEAGERSIFFVGEFGGDLNPDALRLFAGLIAVCNHYGAVVVVARRSQLLTISNE
jgi:hypothetical protein